MHAESSFWQVSWTPARKVDEVRAFQRSQPARIKGVLSYQNVHGLHLGAQFGKVADAHARPALWAGRILQTSRRRKHDDAGGRAADPLQQKPVDGLHLRQVFA